MSGDPEQEYFSDGITEDIITDLSKVSGFFVVARNTAFTYKGKHVDVQEVAKRFRRQLYSGRKRAKGRLPCSRYRPANQRERQRSRLGRPLRSRLNGHFRHPGRNHPRHRGAAKSEAAAAGEKIHRADTYRQRRSLHLLLERPPFFPSPLKSYYQFARQMFAKAVELDQLMPGPTLALLTAIPFFFCTISAPVGIQRILETSAKALALESGLAEAHASRGLALSLKQRYEEAMEEFEKAIALDPNSFEGHYLYARACFAQGELERAAALFERAAEIKPDDYQSRVC